MSTVTHGTSVLDRSKDSIFLQEFMGLDTNIIFGKPRPLDYAKILDYYLRNPNKTAYNYCKDNHCKPSSSEERTGYRHIQQLAKKGFLEQVIGSRETRPEIARNNPNPYRLSLSCIFHIILNEFVNLSHYIDVIRNLQKNYKENPLFSLFLYPIINEKTIHEIEYDVSFYQIVVEYLRNICKDIIAAVKWLKLQNEKTRPYGGYSNRQVFDWYTDSRDNDNEDLKLKIKFFLSTSLKWDNMDSLAIYPKNDENVIELVDATNPSRNSTIKISEKDRKAVLRQSGVKKFEFSVLPNKGFLAIQTKGDTKPIDEIKSPFNERCQKHHIGFIAQLQTQIPQSDSCFTNPSFETLSKDEKIQQGIRALRNYV